MLKNIEIPKTIAPPLIASRQCRQRVAATLAPWMMREEEDLSITWTELMDVYYMSLSLPRKLKQALESYREAIEKKEGFHPRAKGGAIAAVKGAEQLILRKFECLDDETLEDRLDAIIEVLYLEVSASEATCEKLNALRNGVELPTRPKLAYSEWRDSVS